MANLGKKMRKEARIEMRKHGANYREQFLKRLEVFNDCLRPRPRFVPKALWKRWVNTVIDLADFERRINS